MALTLAKIYKKLRDLEIVTNRIGKRQDNQIGISSVRAGNIVGEHGVIFAKRWWNYWDKTYSII